MGPRAKGVIREIAGGAVTGGYGPLSARFTALVGFPDSCHPEWVEWKKAYFEAVIQEATTRLEHIEDQLASLPQPEPIGTQEEQP